MQRETQEQSRGEGGTGAGETRAVRHRAREDAYGDRCAGQSLSPTCSSAIPSTAALCISASATQPNIHHLTALDSAQGSGQCARESNRAGLSTRDVPEPQQCPREQCLLAEGSQTSGLQEVGSSCYLPAAARHGCITWERNAAWPGRWQSWSITPGDATVGISCMRLEMV